MNNILPDRHRMMMQFAPVDTMPNNEIWYTYRDGRNVSWLTGKTISNNNPLISNVYANGSGVFTFTYPVTNIANNGMSPTEGDDRYALTSITLPRYIRSMGNYAVYNNKYLNKVVLPYSLRTIGDYAFNGTIVPDVILPDFVYSLGSYLYANNIYLKSFYMPDSVTTIGQRLFRECSSLARVRLSNSLTDLKDGIFQECTALRTVDIPASVTTIGRYFILNSGITTVIIRNRNSVISLGSQPGITSRVTIYVPNNLLTAYRGSSSAWKAFNLVGYDPDSEYLQ